MNKIFLLSDIHYGLRNSNKDWLDLQKEYIYNFFIPLVKQEKNPILIIAGDVFDNRQSINIMIMNSVIDIFTDLSKIFKEIHIIAGNHDVFLKSSNDITSLESLNGISNNIFIYKTEKVITINNKNILLLPWNSDLIKEKEVIKEYEDKVDYLICHSEVKGFKYNNSIIVEDGNDFSIFKNYKKVYSGHFHFRQEKGNFKYIGCPQHYTRNDIGDRKGIYIINTKDNSEQFIENLISPEYIKLNFDDILETTLGELKNIIRNNFVDLYIRDTYILKYDINPFIAELTSAKDIKIRVIEDKNINTVIETTDSKNSVIELCSTYIEQNNYTEIDKKKIIDYITNIYNKVSI